MLSGLDLLESLLTFDATRRVSARDAIKHAYLNDYHNREPSARHPLRIEDEVLVYVPPESDGLLFTTFFALNFQLCVVSGSVGADF